MKKTDKVTWKGHTLTVEQVMESNESCLGFECNTNCPLYKLEGECEEALPGFSLEALKLAVED